MRLALGSGGRFIEREGVSTLSIHGYPWALRYLLICVFKSVCFSIVSGFERVSFKISVRLLYQSSRVFEKLFLQSFGDNLLAAIFDRP